MVVESRSVRLSELFVDVEGWRTVGPVDVEIQALTYRSDHCAPGCLFFCVPGFVRDGHDFAEAAVARGAAALCVERPLELPVPQVVVPSVRAAMGPVAAVFYDHPSRRLLTAGITGTNGKTTSAFLLAHLCDGAGLKAGLLGTVERRIGGRSFPAGRTTPEAIDVQRDLADMAAAGDRAAVMEVSSHALDQGRARGIEFRAVAFTNLTQDHLDYHKSMEEYFLAKRRLFVDPAYAATRPLKVINLDDPYGRRLARECVSERVLGFSTLGRAAERGNAGGEIADLQGTELLGPDPRCTDPRGSGLRCTDPHGPDPRCTDPRGADFRGRDSAVPALEWSRFEITPQGTRGVLVLRGRALELVEPALRRHTRRGEFGPELHLRVVTPLVGAFNVANTLTALALGLGFGLEAEQMLADLARFPGVPGRMETVSEGQDFLVIVDYAHTPDSVRNVLATARQFTKARLIAVLGCGGDRDRGKRPLMGREAEAHADVVVITSDNPRSEDPRAIIDDILAGLEAPEKALVKPDRRQAITDAVGLARTGDVVMILGKGHESGQEFAGTLLPFDDRQVAREALRSLQRRTGTKDAS